MNGTETIGGALRSILEGVDRLDRCIDAESRADADSGLVKYTAVERGGKWFIKVRAYRQGRFVGGDDNRTPWPNKDSAMKAAERAAREVNDRELGGQGHILSVSPDFPGMA